MAQFQGSQDPIRDATRLIRCPHAHRLVPCRCVVTPTSNLEFDGVRVLAGAVALKMLHVSMSFNKALFTRTKPGEAAWFDNGRESEANTNFP